MKYAKKSLGQNFLKDVNVIKKIINLVSIYDQHVLEIGPGKGALTNQILKKHPKSLILIEKDFVLFKELKDKYSSNKKIKIYNEDILKFDLEKKLVSDTTIIGNLPYNISSQILIKLVKFEKWLPKYKKLILMFQKEVADKILAKFNTINYGRISIITNSRLKITNHFNVSQNSFYPVPKVKSTILVFEPFINRNFKVKDINNLEKVSHIFFSKKRKMINKGFKQLFKNPLVIAKKIKINLELRPSELTENEYFKITEFFEKQN